MTDEAADAVAWIMSCPNPFTGEDGWDVEIRRALEGPSYESPALKAGASLFEWLTYHDLMDDVILGMRTRPQSGGDHE